MNKSYFADYDREGLETYQHECWEVIDPWTCETRGIFFSKKDADLFCKAVYKKFKKRQAKLALKKLGGQE